MKVPVSVIDFGTSKIVTLIAENSSSQRCDVVGAGVAPYDGYLPEGWNNPGDLNEAIMASVKEAEDQSKKKIRDVYVGVPGAFTKVYATEAMIELKGTDPRVTANDVKSIFAVAKENLQQIPGIVVHSSPAWFMVDDGKKTLEPVGLKGRQFRAMISFVVANQFFVDDVNNRLADLGITATGFFSTPAGEAMLYLPEEDRDRTAVLLDIGYLDSEVMVMEGDALIYHDYIDVGGGHIAADLTEGLDISLAAAEKIKRDFVYGIATPDTSYEAPAADGGKPQVFERDAVAAVIEPRVDEIAELIAKSLEDSGVRLGNWSNVYLTGGGLAFNRGGRDYLGGKLGKPVRETPKRTTKLNNPVFSSALGLMDLVINSMEQSRQRGGFVDSVKHFFSNLVGG